MYKKQNNLSNLLAAYAAVGAGLAVAADQDPKPTGIVLPAIKHGVEEAKLAIGEALLNTAGGQFLEIEGDRFMASQLSIDESSEVRPNTPSRNNRSR